MWGTFLSEPLRIVALVGRYPANQLMRRMPIPDRRIFHQQGMRPDGIWGIRPSFPGLSPCPGQVAYVLLTSAPVAARVLLPRAAPRLACVKPVASVHPEPGSNSSLLYYRFFFFSKEIKMKTQRRFVHRAPAPHPFRGACRICCASYFST